MDGLEDAFAPAGTSPGWAKLGAMLAGGGRRESDMAGMRGYSQGVSIQNALLEARKRRDAEVGRQAMAKAAFDAGDNDLGNAMLQGAGDNLGQLGNYRLDKQKLGLLSAAQALASQPDSDMNALNRLMIVAGGKPVDLTKIEDHSIFNPMMTPDSQTIATNEIGSALIGKYGAEAGAAHALAGERNAHARLYNTQSAAGGFAGGSKSPSLMDAFNPDQPTGEAFLATLDPNERAIVQAVVDGRYPVPTGRAASSPEWLRVVHAATQVDPSFDASNYAARAAARKDFTSGKSSQQILSLNTLAHHMKDLQEAVDGLDNRSSPMWNKVANSTLAAFGDPRVAAFQSAATPVAEEFAKLLKGSAPSVTEVEHARESLNSDMSPEQLRASLSTMASQVEGRLTALDAAQHNGLGLGARSHGVPVITQEARELFDMMLGGKNAPAHAQPASGIGAVITGKDGRRYRITGGDPNDPDVEPIE